MTPLLLQAEAEATACGAGMGGGGELLSSFNVATFKNEEDDAAFWSRLIPVAEQPPENELVVRRSAAGSFRCVHLGGTFELCVLSLCWCCGALRDSTQWCVLLESDSNLKIACVTG